MGPILIPKRGSTIELNYSNWLLYHKYIEWECSKRVEWRDSVARIDNAILERYTFKDNYCFAACDHVIDSRDSRYFGLVPEKFIIGTVGIVLRGKRVR